jgi:hypothetical protein
MNHVHTVWGIVYTWYHVAELAYKRGWNQNLRIRKLFLKCGPDSSDSGQGPVEGSCEHRKDISDSTVGGIDLLDHWATISFYRRIMINEDRSKQNLNNLNSVTIGLFVLPGPPEHSARCWLLGTNPSVPANSAPSWEPRSEVDTTLASDAGRCFISVSEFYILDITRQCLVTVMKYTSHSNLIQNFKHRLKPHAVYCRWLIYWYSKMLD